MLIEQGHQAEHVIDVGPADASDGDLWRYALDNQAVIVTKDEDFADMTAVRSPAPVIVWVRIGNTTRRGLLEWFQPLLGQVVEMVETGNNFIELR
ncbi:DUF5615 family PIN-like protein [Isoptericola dokdonensis]|jgi:predicted nuclease of predicted toxin-antitoxin system|uniref:DUF5615 domain-containing protein n=1 Tax=Isoptericola dokdonensis DS-3 TaxID=1300344 RepID=A0A168ERD8_9MICO|nr:DUF5615 family PIN-like protein [Isoptericola dokdonensis]ANC30376.1 hypothetical protein I598_0800 [Isoptericola dokdonensis DS-3]